MRTSTADVAEVPAGETRAQITAEDAVARSRGGYTVSIRQGFRAGWRAHRADAHASREGALERIWQAAAERYGVSFREGFRAGFNGRALFEREQDSK